MRWIGILLAAIVLMSVPAYAQITAAGSADVAVKADARIGVNGPRPVPADFNRMPPAERAKYREHVMEILRQRLGDKKLQELRERGISPEAIATRVLEKREAAAKAHGLVVASAQVKKWQDIAERYRRAVMRIRNATLRYIQKKREWAEYRAKFQRGEIDENTYFQKAKEMILAAIDATIERLESVREHADDSSAIDAAISKLKEIRAEVDAAESLDELRAIYGEKVLPELREQNRRLFAKYYVVGTIRATMSVVSRLDVAVSRLTRYVEFAKSKGIYDEEMEARVNAILADVEAVKAELNALQAEVKAKDIQNPREYMNKIRAIKEEVVKIYREIRDLIVDYNRRIAVKIRNRIKARATAKHEGEEKTSTKQSAETHTESEATEGEANTSVEVTAEVKNETNASHGKENTEQNANITASAEISVNGTEAGSANVSVAVNTSGKGDTGNGETDTAESSIVTGVNISAGNDIVSGEVEGSVEVTP